MQNKMEDANAHISVFRRRSLEALKVVTPWDDSLGPLV